MTIFKRKTPVRLIYWRLIYWRAYALLLSWALLAFALTVINHTTTHLNWQTFLKILSASVGYLFATAALLKPLTKNPK
jgi:hypothetical protein